MELYDHASDPRETRNVVGDRLPEAARLRHVIAEIETTAAEQAVAHGSDAEMDSVTRERLRALGYVQ